MKSDYRYIEELASQAIEKAGCTALPIDVEKVAAAMELEVVPFAFHNKISGLLKKEDGVIGVNQAHHHLRQRFTIAHELGHFLLGHGLGEEHQEETVDDVFDKPRPIEREANRFASALLMPEARVKKHVKKTVLKSSSLPRCLE